jgi:hypothetical protein
MPDYSEAKIYTIQYKNDVNLIYVGSTCKTLACRWSQHKYNYKDKTYNGYNSKFYQKLRETDDISGWHIELYEIYPCKNKSELQKRESDVIQNIGTLNMTFSKTKTNFQHMISLRSMDIYELINLYKY